MNENIVIAIDGPAGAGKSTIAKKIAEIFNIDYIDTGAMYRALTFKLLNSKININNESEIVEIIINTDIDFKDNHIYLDGINVDDKIRDNIINKNVSNIAKMESVRDYMVDLQRKISSEKSVIMDGRDIGSVVLPDADFKFFLTSSIEERAKRRYNQLLDNGVSHISLNDIRKEIDARDYIDRTRKMSPLIKSEGAYEIDTTNKTIDQSIDEITNIIERM